MRAAPALIPTPGSADAAPLTRLLVSRSIVSLEFEWHGAEAEANWQVDPFAIDRVDDRGDYGEERFVIIGRAEALVLLFVVYTERVENIRIISARRATQDEQDDYFRQNAQTDDSRSH
jgi:uncharacterized DUF497 family protein